MQPNSRMQRPSVLNTVATSLLAIAAVVGIYFAATSSSRVVELEDPLSEEGQQLIEGNDYRILVAVARVEPSNSDGEAWDSGAEKTAAPDPFYEIRWRDNLVYKSEEVENVLVASWSNVALPKLYELLTDEVLSLETIKEGALITARPGETLQIRVIDKDPLNNDLIEEFEVSIDELTVGDQVREGSQGLESLTLRVIPRDSNELRHFLK